MKRVLPDQDFAVRDELKKSHLRIVLGAAFALMLFAGSAAVAADDEEDDTPFEEKLLQNLMGTNKPSIDYRERSPLVVPPTSTLPQPEVGKSVADPSWPKDADAQRAKKVKRRNDPYTRALEESGRPLTPYEMAGRPGNGGVGAPSSAENERNAAGAPLSPTALGSKGNLFGSIFSSKEATESAVFPGEAPRAALTEPPKGYMTPSPNYPYGLSPTKVIPVPYEQKVQDLGTR